MAASGSPGDVSDSVTSCDLSDIKVTMNVNLASHELLAPADSYVTCERTGVVKLRSSSDNADPILVPTLLANAAETHPEHAALAHRMNGQWTYINYREYHKLTRQVAKGFIKLGLEPRSGVALIGFNSPEWNIAYMAAIFANGIACGMYKSFTAETCENLISRLNANIVVVDDDEQLSKILDIRHKLPSLHAIVHYKGSTKETGVYSWSDLQCIGSNVTDDELDERMKGLRANACCSIILTSGTTGKPKAVMLSHDNLTFSIMAARGVPKMATGVSISYRPMGHGTSVAVDVLVPLLLIATVFFIGAEDMKGDLLEALRQVKPTVLIGSPIIWERFERRIKHSLDNASGLWRWAVLWARSIGTKAYKRLQNGQSLPCGWSFAEAIVFRKVREEIGLDRCNVLVTGSAPITADTVEFLASIGLILNQGYGTTEAGTLSSNVFIPGQSPWKPMSVGKPHTAIELLNVDERGIGEIYVDGRMVFMGYLGDEEQTTQAFDEKWRLHTGDYGRLDDDGALYIMGRVKDTIITSNGFKVIPLPIENRVKEALPMVSNCVVVGDKQLYMSILLCLKSESHPSGQEPLDEMAAETKEWCRQLGTKATTISEVAGNRDRLVNQAIQAALDRINETVDRPSQKLRHFYILPKDFSVAGGELGGPLEKIMRANINSKYKDVIKHLYENPEDYNHPEIAKF